MYLLKISAIAFILGAPTVAAAPRKPRLTLAEPMPNYYHRIGGDSGAYLFGYDVWDPATGNTQFRNEERYPNGTVSGSYGYVDALGEARAFKYVADERGYRVRSINNIRNQISTPNQLNQAMVSTTESSITWTRPSKKKSQQNKRNTFTRRKYNDVQPPGYYLLY